MKLVAATGNSHKIEEFRQMFGSEYEIVGISEFAVNFDPDENGKNFDENAIIKAREAFRLCGMPCFADDSGLCVDALGGMPGIYSARYAKPGLRKATVLEKLKNVPEQERSAHFACSIAYCDGKNDFVASGKCFGHILFAPTGDGGFGYDPIFFCNELGKGFAECTAADKNRVSHRAKAFELFLVGLAQIQKR